MKATVTSEAHPPPHPFGSLLEPDEPLLWLARPDLKALRAQQKKVYPYIAGFGAAVLVFVLAASWPFTLHTATVYAASAIISVQVGFILASCTVSGNEEWSVTWYALTPQRLLKQSLDTDAEDSHRITQVVLTDLKRLRLRNRYVCLGISGGTITCYTPAWFAREHLTLDCIEDPDAVLGLIESARTQLLVASQPSLADDKVQNAVE